MKIALRSIEMEEVVIDILNDQGGLSDLLLDKQIEQRSLINTLIDKYNLMDEVGYDRDIVNDMKNWLHAKRVDSVTLSGVYNQSTTIEKYNIDGETYIYIYREY